MKQGQEMKKRILLSMIAAPLLIIGCGGDSTTTTNASITGTVPGTLIEAFCDNGYYVKVTSVQNGTSEHPFEIEVPMNTNCRLVMTTNENDAANRIITPIGFTNGNTIVLSGDINLGHIPLELSYEHAHDYDGDHVVDTPLIVDPSGAVTNTSPVQDSNSNDLVDSYDDDDDDNIPNAYEDYDDDGLENLHDDDDDDYHDDYHDDDDDSSDDSSDSNDDSSDDSSDDVYDDDSDDNEDDDDHDDDDDSDDDDDDDSDDDK